MSTFNGNSTLKVNRAITGATTVASNGYAIVSYRCTSYVINTGSVAAIWQPLVERHFGPSQSIPASFTSGSATITSTNQATLTYSLESGVEFVNTP